MDEIVEKSIEMPTVNEVVAWRENESAYDYAERMKEMYDQNWQKALIDQIYLMRDINHGAYSLLTSGSDQYSNMEDQVNADTYLREYFDVRDWDWDWDRDNYTHELKLKYRNRMIANINLIRYGISKVKKISIRNYDCRYVRQI